MLNTSVAELTAAQAGMSTAVAGILTLTTATQRQQLGTSQERHDCDKNIGHSRTNTNSRDKRNLMGSNIARDAGNRKDVSSNQKG
jgi:hypothetical protein